MPELGSRAAPGTAGGRRGKPGTMIGGRAAIQMAERVAGGFAELRGACAVLCECVRRRLGHGRVAQMLSVLVTRWRNGNPPWRAPHPVLPSLSRRPCALG